MLLVSEAHSKQSNFTFLDNEDITSYLPPSTSILISFGSPYFLIKSSIVIVLHIISVYC